MPDYSSLLNDRLLSTSGDCSVMPAWKLANKLKHLPSNIKVTFYFALSFCPLIAAHVVTNCKDSFGFIKLGPTRHFSHAWVQVVPVAMDTSEPNAFFFFFFFFESKNSNFKVAISDVMDVGAISLSRLATANRPPQTRHLDSDHAGLSPWIIWISSIIKFWVVVTKNGPLPFVCYW